MPLLGADVVKFYNMGEPYYEFTNFYGSPIKLDGKVWPTTEHYFQAQKFNDPAIQEEIRNKTSPRAVFDTANALSNKAKIRSDWHTIQRDGFAFKDHVMLKAIRAKFTQHANLTQLLLDTKLATIEEASPHDAYWGTGANGLGKNMLGKTLMKVRGELNRTHAVTVLPHHKQTSPANLSNALKIAAVAVILYGLNKVINWYF